jgi:hypothetical protein
MATATLSINLVTLLNTLEKRGFSKEQAHGVAEAIQQIDTTALATKQDVAGIRDEIKDLQIGLYKFLTGVLIAHALGTAALTVSLIQLFR